MRGAALIPAITQDSGQYSYHPTEGPIWSYAYEIRAAGSRSELRSGSLLVGGKEVRAAVPGDRMETPWGPMQLMSDTYERGWLLEGTFGRPIDATHGKVLPVPEGRLSGSGRWSAEVERWTCVLQATAHGTRSERLCGRLYHGRAEVVGQKVGDRVSTPWGVMYWLGPTDEVHGSWEQGWLLRGTGDRALADLPGRVIEVPDADMGGTARVIDSLYLSAPVLGGHQLGLSLPAESDAATWEGVLTVDPNTCSLDEFGDRHACTRMAVRRHTVHVEFVPTADPRHLGRKLFRVRGAELPEHLWLVAWPDSARWYLNVDGTLVPMCLTETFTAA